MRYYNAKFPQGSTKGVIWGIMSQFTNIITPVLISFDTHL